MLTTPANTPFDDDLSDDDTPKFDTRAAADYLTGKGTPIAKKTLDKMRSVGGGPVFLKIGPRFVRYTPRRLDIWRINRTRIVHSTSELQVAQARDGGPE